MASNLTQFPYAKPQSKRENTPAILTDGPRTLLSASQKRKEIPSSAFSSTTGRVLFRDKPSVGKSKSATLLQKSEDLYDVKNLNMPASERFLERAREDDDLYALLREDVEKDYGYVTVRTEAGEVYRPTKISLLTHGL